MSQLRINIDCISPITDKLSPVTDCIGTLIPKPPEIHSFKNNIKPIYLYIQKYSDGTYNISKLNKLIRDNRDNFREKFLYTLVNNNFYNNIIEKYSYYTEWLKHADYIKNRN
tara:strand:- start:3466 stop:3801 length:336 start_codon:yes stop_codon:yes gene_type:complete